EAGMPLIHLAMGFVLAHPGVTSAIIGPRSMEQLTSLLDGASVSLSDDVLDRSNQIVAPGVTLNYRRTPAGMLPCSLTWPHAGALRSAATRPSVDAGGYAAAGEQVARPVSEFTERHRCPRLGI